MVTFSEVFSIPAKDKAVRTWKQVTIDTVHMSSISVTPSISC